MSNLLKGSLVVALVAGLFALYATFFLIKPRQEKLKSDLTTTIQNLQTTQKNLATANSNLETTKTNLEQTKEKLATVKSDLEAAKTDLAKAEARANEADAMAKDLTAKVTARDQKIADYEKKIADAGAPIEEMKATITDLKQKAAVVEGENKQLTEKVKQQEQDIAQLKGLEGRVPLPSGLRGQILVYEKNWNFVVINVGRSSGALQNGELDVYRNTKFVGKVRLTAVNTHLAIANVLPQWSKMEIKEGDMVMPAS